MYEIFLADNRRLEIVGSRYNEFQYRSYQMTGSITLEDDPSGSGTTGCTGVIKSCDHTVHRAFMPEHNEYAIESPLFQ